MEDEIDVSTDDKKDETPVSFIESDGDTLVQVGGESKKEAKDDDRWRSAEAAQNRLAADLADVRSRLAGNGGPPQSGPSSAPDPYSSQLDAISERERALGIQWEAYKRAGRLSGPEGERLLVDFDNKARGLAQERNELAAQRAVQQALPSIIQTTRQQQFRAKYSDVQSNPNANRWARGYFDQLVAQGHPDSEETVDQAMNAARSQFRLANRSSPTEQDRQQYTGFSGNTGRRNVNDKTNVVKMGKSEKIMAMSMYGDRFNGDEKKAYSQWAKGPGIRAQKAMQKARRANAG